LSSPFITIDGTGARHGRHEDYVVNDAALVYMRERGVEVHVIDKLAAHPQVFRSLMVWLEHLAALPFDVCDRGLLGALREGALWGSIRDHGLLDNTVVVSHDAGQFRGGSHALCWVCRAPGAQADARNASAGTSSQGDPRSHLAVLSHSEGLEEHTFSSAGAWPHAAFRPDLRSRDRLSGAGQAAAKIASPKSGLLRVLDYPDIPLHTNASENDIRACVSKRKLSGAR
jgi:hypothetical protein